MQTPTFFHEIPLQIQLQGKAQTIHFAAGFSKAVDPLSGMTVNLVIVQKWLANLSKEVRENPFSDPLQFLNWTQARLEPAAKQVGAELKQVQIRSLDQTRIWQTGGQFYFQKSGNCTLGESSLPLGDIRIVKITFRISDLLGLDHAVQFQIPARISGSGENVLAELQSQVSVPLEQVEILDGIQKVSQVLLS